MSFLAHAVYTNKDYFYIHVQMYTCTCTLSRSYVPCKVGICEDSHTLYIIITCMIQLFHNMGIYGPNGCIINYNNITTFTDWNLVLQSPTVSYQSWATVDRITLLHCLVIFVSTLPHTKVLGNTCTCLLKVCKETVSIADESIEIVASLFCKFHSNSTSGEENTRKIMKSFLTSEQSRCLHLPCIETKRNM